MTRGDQLIPEIDRLAAEVALVYKELVLPGWNGAQHGLTNTLFGYMMCTFSRIDLISAYWRGTFKSQSESQSDRMVSFMDEYMNPDRLTNSLAVKVWRHKLMHTSSPRKMRYKGTCLIYEWLLHWGDDHLPREQHFKFQPGGLVLNLSLSGLIDNTRTAAESYRADLAGNSVLEKNYDKVDIELDADVFEELPRPRASFPS